MDPSSGPSGPHWTIRVPELAAPSVASATKSGQTNATFAPESLKKKSISPDLSSGFIGTTTAPASREPKNTTGKAGTFGRMIATRSPGSTPAARSDPATLAAMACRWA